MMWKSLKRSSYNTKRTIFYHSSIYTLHCNIYMLHDFYGLYSTKSSPRLLNGVQICKILLRRKCWEPWQAKSSRSTFQWDWKIGSLGRTLPRGVQIMLCLVPPKSWWGGGYIQNIYKIYTEYIQNVSACEVFSAMWLQTLSLWCFSDFGQTEKKLDLR